MGCGNVVSSSGDPVLGDQLCHRRKGGVRRRMAVSDDRTLYRIREVLYDSDDRAYAGISSGAGTAGGTKDFHGQDGALCAIPAAGNGGDCMAVRRRMAGGYMTVEASFIISWTLFVFVFLIYLSFYSYDKCVLFQDAYTVCFRGSIQKNEDNVVPYINAHIQEQFGRKYFGTGEVHGSVDKNGHVTDVTGECQVKVPIRSLFTMYDKSGWKIRTRARAQIVNPTHIIRKSRWVGNMFTE